MPDDPLREIFDNNIVRIAFIGVLAILALFLLAETVTVAENFGRTAHPATDTITVTGSGQATLPPDVARVSFVIENTAVSVSAAQAATTQQANSALAFVKGQGVLDKDVKTLSYTITPQYVYPKPCGSGALCPAYTEAPKIIGYQVAETIQVTLHDLSAVGSFLGGLGKLAVQNVSGPAFALDDPTSGYDAARADAITKAKAQAALLAKQLGVSLGKIVTFSESSNSSYPVPYGAMRSAAVQTAATPEVPAGENTYNASVSITYEIR